MSTYYGEGIQPSQVQMLPKLADTELEQIWSRSYVPSVNADVYVSPACPDGLVESALEFAQTPVDELRLSDEMHDSHGSQADILKVAGHIVKVSRSGTQAVDTYTFRDIIAAEALHVGLEVTTPALPSFPGLTISAPEQYAAIVPRRDGDKLVRVTGVMEFAEGFPVVFWNDDLPSEKTRKRVYDAALEAVQIKPELIELDDEWSTNTVVRRSAIDRSPVHISKLDIRAYCPLYPKAC